VSAPETIADALVALVRKYPGVLRIPDAIDRVAALTGVDRTAVHYGIDDAIHRGVVSFGDEWFLTIPGAVPNPRRPPLPLTSPDGRVFAWACAHCLCIGGSGMTPWEATPDAMRTRFAALSLEWAERCGDCMDCKVFRPEHVDEGSTCAACLAALRARQPKGAWVPCDDCHATGKREATVGGEAVVIDCPTCEGDGQVWRAET